MGFFLLKPFYWVKCSPNKVFEYLICGVVPVIRANIDHEETLSPCSLIFDQSYSDDEIVNDVLNVIKNKDVMLHKMVKARELSEKFTWEKVAPQYIEAYNSLQI